MNLTKIQKRKARENKMSEYLIENGWTCSGPFKDVWKISNWEKEGTCFRTLSQAYKLQYRLNAKQTSGIDDNLVNSILD